MKIKILSQKAINAISSGTTIAAPEFAFKELLENAIDSGATIINCELLRGGRTLISISDNGEGISKDDLPLAMMRHTTSKLIDEDVTNIIHLGFRGEALHAIASCSLMQITSREPKAEKAWCIDNSIQEGPNGSVTIDFRLNPAARSQGTTVEVRDIFCLTPNRLRFLKSETAETNACLELVQRFALAYPGIAFTLHSNGKQLARFQTAYPEHNTSIRAQSANAQEPLGLSAHRSSLSLGAILITQAEPANYPGLIPLKTRINDVCGEDFIENSVFICEKRNGILLYGFANVPTHHRGKTRGNRIFCYINGRAVKDNLLHLLIKTAYNNVLPSEYSPSVVLYFEIPPQMLDVNVHPNKTQVRFADEAEIRGLVIGALKKALSHSQVTSRLAAHFASHLTAQVETMQINSQHQEENSLFSRLSEQHRNFSHYMDQEAHVLTKNFASPDFNPYASELKELNIETGKIPHNSWFSSYRSPLGQILADTPADENSYMNNTSQAFPLNTATNAVLPTATMMLAATQSTPTNRLSLGQPLCQLQNRYIIATNGEELIIVDQHAVHERYVLEQLKDARNLQGIASQQLLIPEVVQFTIYEIQQLLAIQNELAKLGLQFSPNSECEKSLLITAIPAIFPFGLDISALFLKIIENISIFSEITLYEMDKILGEIACYSSVRSGKILDLRSMDRLLRMVESTDFAAQCNHGRPTYIALPLSYIDKLFERI